MSTETQLPRKILIVDDDASSVQMLREFLQKQSVLEVLATDLSRALYQFANQKFEAAIISLEFKDISGLALAQKFRTNDSLEKKCIPIIITSKQRTRLKTEEMLAEEIGNIEFVPKSIKPIQILGPLSRSMTKREELLRSEDIQERVLTYYNKTKQTDKTIEAIKKQLPVLGEKGLELMIDIYSKSGRNDEALAIISQLSEKSLKSNIKLLNHKASILTKMGRFEEAMESFKKADELAPKNMNRIQAMADLYLQLNLPEESIRKYKEFLEINPENPDMKFNVFERMITAGFPDQARNFCKETTLPQEVSRHYNNVGVLYAKRNEILVAIEKYQLSLKLIPNNPESYRILFNLALAHLHVQEDNDRIEKAKRYLQECLALSPQFEKAKVLLQKITTV